MGCAASTKEEAPIISDCPKVATSSPTREEESIQYFKSILSDPKIEAIVPLPSPPEVIPVPLPPSLGSPVIDGSSFFDSLGAIFCHFGGLTTPWDPVDSNTLQIRDVPKLSIGNLSTKERQVRLAAKRGNVFSFSVDDDTRRVFNAKKIPKTRDQEKLIRSALKENFVFQHHDESDTKILVEAMTIVNVDTGSNVINQGERGDFFYVVGKGIFAVIIDGVRRAHIMPGESFGELALLYDIERSATVQAESSATLFALDRDTFKFTLANNMEDRNAEIRTALKRVPLLRGLTSQQMDRLADAVILVDFNPEDCIVRKGSEGRLFFMIKAGTAVVDGMGDKLPARRLGPGDYFGEKALMTNEPRTASVTAETTMVLLALDKEAFLTLLGPLQEVLDHNFNMQALSNATIFHNMTKQEKGRVCKAFCTEKFNRGDTIIRQGDRGSRFNILVDGAATVVGVNGKVVNELRAGDYFGEMALLDNDDVCKASVVAKVGCKCSFIERDDFDKLLGEGQGSSLLALMRKETETQKGVLSLPLRGSRLRGLGGEGAAASSSTLTTSPKLLLRDLKQLAVLGWGVFSKVTLVQHSSSGDVYALKIMLKHKISKLKQQKNVINEKKTILMCKHPFILGLLQTFKDPKRLYMLLEFIQGGELFSLIHKPNQNGIPNDQAKFYAAGVLLALEHLHSKDIAYRDMKPENCLIDKLGYPKLVDFGFAKAIIGKSYTLCGTAEYLAPEMVLGRGHDKAVDYWAFGVLVFEMQTGHSPFYDPSGKCSDVVIFKNIVDAKLKFDRGFNSDCKELVKRLLVKELPKRLGCLKGGDDDIQEANWFLSLDMETYLRKALPAPWIPPLRGPTDVSLFDPCGDESDVDDHECDHGSWDKNF